jgi:hypothetical protein
VDADVTFDFTHQGDHLLAVQGGGRTTTRMGDRRVGRTISKIDVRLLEADSIPENAWASLREGYQRESAGPKHPLFTANYARGARLQRMRARIREYPLQALLRRAESLDQASAAARTRWFLRATAHCVLEERACGRLGELFAGAAAEGAAARVTAAVLVDAATAGAHRVIARLLTDPRLSAAHKIHLLTALSAAESLAPSIATAVERLQTRADSVGRSAALLQKAHAARIETTGRIK